MSTPSTPERSYVAVVGPGAGAAPADTAAAQETGALLAESGATLVCGGLGGVMEAACRGARQRGGVTVGILPGRRHGEGNSYLTVELPTGLGEMRNALVVAAAEAVIAIGGSWGTLSEVALAMRTGTPVFAISGWPVGAPDGGPRAAGSPAEAVQLALAAVREARAARRP
jgi:uncharacterized protein (TIGR00725 family)